jgi:outer membrane receptor for ferrienterochelin and colicin
LIDYSQTAFRRQVFVRRNDGTLARTIYFDNRPESSRANFELSGFAEDRWSVSDRWLVELGLRFDWDQILRRPLFSPRLASTYMIGGGGETKVSFGAGLFYDATNLGILANSGNGRRFDQFYDRDGTTPRSDLLVTSFEVNEHDLAAPRFSNWSVGIEHRLPGAIYLDVEYIGRHGTRGLAYLTPGTGAASGVFELQNERRDRYDGLQFTVRRTFKDTYSVMASYTRSSSRSNVAIEPGFDDPVFSLVAGGPLPWDSPNRLLSWGWMPLPKKFELSYSLDWHDGFPFSVVNEDQRMIGAVNSHRFPDYFAINLHVERRFRLLNFEWALRAGFNNITDHRNAALVDNNIDSPFFLTYQAIQGRTFTGRVRFLGRK